MLASCHRVRVFAGSNGLSDCVNVFLWNQFVPFDNRLLSDYEIRQGYIFCIRMLHTHVVTTSPLSSCHMTKFGTYGHRSTDGFDATFNFAVKTHNYIICPELGSMQRGEVHISEVFFNTIAELLSSLGSFISWSLWKSWVVSLLLWIGIAFSIMVTVFILLCRVTENTIFVEMNHATLIFGIWAYFWYRFESTKVYAFDDEANTNNTMFF